MMRIGKMATSLAAMALVLTSCGGGNSSGTTPAPSPTPTPNPAPPPAGGNFTAPAQESLSVGEVQQIIAQAVGEAQRRNLPSVIAVVDRVGNVLGVFRMSGARTLARTSALTEAGINSPLVDAQGLDVPAEIAAISKAVTGAYLSSGGNAFSSRTASQIVQQHFPPAPSTRGLESGPLFGVQFSQLPCSDLSARFQAAGGASALIGPKRSPLGLAADPGGLPLYKNGVVVGAIGVMGDGDYGFDPNILDRDIDPEEAIAFAGTQGFAAAEAIRADRITVDGTTLRFSDIIASDIGPLSGNFAAINGTAGSVIAVRGYSTASIIAGTPYGTEASGMRAARAAEFANADAFILTDGAGNNRYPIRAGTDSVSNSQPLTAAEVRAILEEAFTVLTRARAQIRRPLDSRMQASISVVDTHGEVLGIVRSPDAPIFGIDVSLQKARTAMFFSHPQAASNLMSAGGGVAPFVSALRTFLGNPQALTGTIAFSDRANGNLSRPYFPDGELGRPPGPFSRPIEDFNPFAVGLQVQLVAANIIQHSQFVSGASPTDTAQRCTALPDTVQGQNRLENGIQIFPGSVPIYRGNVLVGGIGVSGDGIDQDDMVSFLGLNNGGARVGTVGNAPKDMRADRVVVNLGNAQVRLRYVSCPFAPFLDTNTQNVCEGL
ncbi:heme-binding protein [Blastomonas sp. AAP53]|uniref:heme-binding protein n=1 Tax=Blastomonas sp. AAP53 TaxID=1248760 RepID=UPI000475E6EE|nr:heme-binding protein [Blastomonas sp. AAP53]